MSKQQKEKLICLTRSGYAEDQINAVEEALESAVRLKLEMLSRLK